MTIASAISHASAVVLAGGGLSLLFAPAAVLSGLDPSFPDSLSWLGQLLGAAWLGLAALNWIQRRAVLGGAFGRPTVFANVIHFFVATMVLVRAAPQGGSGLLWAVTAVFVALTIAYGALLLRGPFGERGSH